jgi:hypothetical protein
MGDPVTHLEARLAEADVLHRQAYPKGVLYCAV